MTETTIKIVASLIVAVPTLGALVLWAFVHWWIERSIRRKK